MKTLDEALDVVAPDFPPDGIFDPNESPTLQRIRENTRQLKADCLANRDVQIMLFVLTKAIECGTKETMEALLNAMVAGIRIGQEMEKD